jgi:hypothetical protein
VTTGIFGLAYSRTPLFYFFYGDYRRVCSYVVTVDTPLCTCEKKRGGHVYKRKVPPPGDYGGYGDYNQERRRENDLWGDYTVATRMVERGASTPICRVVSTNTKVCNSQLHIQRGYAHAAPLGAFQRVTSDT